MPLGNNIRKHSPLTRLKVPTRLLSNSVGEKLKTPLIYYYHAKSFASNGRFTRGSLARYLCSKTGRCLSTVKSNTDKLISLGWIRKERNGFSLCSYDKVWSDCGVDLDKEHIGLMYVNPHGDIESSIIVAELVRNQRRQAKVIEQNIVCKTYSVSHPELLRETRSSILRKRKIALTESNVKAVKLEEFSKLCKLEIASVDSDNSLSCKGFANLFGRTSSMTGWRVQQKLKDLGFIKVENRRVKLCRVPLDVFRMAEVNSSFSWFKGVVYKQFPNRIKLV